MKIVEQSHEVLCISSGLEFPLTKLELAGRTCYKSEDRITADSATKFVQMLKDRGHDAMLEFGWIMVKFITNRGVTHELVRHRLCSFAQESTRYVKYNHDMEFIRPVWIPSDILHMDEFYMDKVLHQFDDHRIGYWLMSMMEAERSYINLLSHGWRPEQAREVLPNSLKTEIVVGANFREWMHIFKLRCAKAAHPQMRELMIPLREELKRVIPVLFEE